MKNDGVHLFDPEGRRIVSSLDLQTARVTILYPASTKISDIIDLTTEAAGIVGGAVTEVALSKIASPVESNWPELIAKLAEIGYQAYGDSCDWKTSDDRSMPKWDDLGRVARRWECAAAAILSGYLGNMAYTLGNWREEVLQVLNDKSGQ